jgi:hypothetical protein
MNNNKTDFLKNKLVLLLSDIPSDTQPLWGKMTLQQMVEHLIDAFRIASGRSEFQQILTPTERLPRMQDFLMSDKPFRENTLNPMLPQDPVPVVFPRIEEALHELQKEVDHFFAVFEANENLSTRNPIFGDLNFEMNVQFLYKHSLHHLRQFGVEYINNIL